MDLCAFCLAELLPLNRAMAGDVRVNETGASRSYRYADLPHMIKEGKHTFYAADRSTLPMVSATSVEGTPCCVLHAVHALMSRRS